MTSTVANLHFIKIVCTHSGPLVFILVAAFLAFAFHPGSLGDIMRLGYLFFGVHFLAGNAHFKSLTKGHLVMLAVVLLVLALSLTVPSKQIHPPTLSYFLAIPGLVLVCHLLACNAAKRPWANLRILGLVTLTVAVLGQLLAHLFMPGANHGVYKNLHHLGLFASICISAAGYFALVLRKWGRMVAIVVGLVALYLLWESSSRVSWLAFFISAGLTVVVSPQKKNFFYLMPVCAGAALLTGVFSGYQDIGIRIDDFWAGWRTEERIYMWGDTIELMKQNNLLDWLRGKGIGSFRYFFENYPGMSIEKLEAQPTFPHNIFLQVLFENGAIGFILIFSALGVFVRELYRGIRRPASDSRRYLYSVCFITFWILFLQTFLTKSIHSKYIAYLFSMTLGIGLVLDLRGRHSQTLSQLFPNLFSRSQSVEIPPE